MSRASGLALLVPTLVAGIALAGCTAYPPAPVSSPTASSVASPAGPSSGASPTITEPTTTNTLPAPPAPTGPAPSTAGSLSAASLPVPAGWRTAKVDGDEESGEVNNGSWVHARDPRYAAQDAITVGCADITRDDYPDPTAALEGDYVDRDGHVGIGLVLDFADAAAARAYRERFVEQVKACTAPGQALRTTIVAEPVAPDGGLGLIDRRTDSEDWTEVVELNGARLTLVILNDPGHRISRARSEALLAQIKP